MGERTVHIGAAIETVIVTLLERKKTVKGMAEYIAKSALRGYTLIPPSTPSGKLIPVSIDDIPAADVRENARGHWIFQGIDYMQDPYCCSCCGNGSPVSGFDFCPNCGADMRGK